MRKIMAVNAGSSSLKFKLFVMPEEKVITEGNVEKIIDPIYADQATENSIYTIKVNGEKIVKELKVIGHKMAVEIVLEDLIKYGIVNDLKEIGGIGHRVVQGGKYFKGSCLVTEDVKDKIRELIDLAPLHNGPHLIGIEAFENALPQTPNVVVFDTAFHQTMSPEAYMYALPYDWYEKYGLRKYGAHGTSHEYVANVAAKIVNKDIKDLKIVTCHIGNGASITAIKGGICVDTSMGLTPLEGVPMGTRCGNIDPTVVQYIWKKEGKDPTEILKILNKESGYLGVSKVSNDSRTVEEGMKEGNSLCKLAFDIQYKRIADYIGSYYVYMGGIDIIVFTAGIGENSSYCRKEVLNRLKVLGVEVDEKANQSRGEIKEITTAESKIRAFIIPTNEELVIARDVMKLTK